MKFIISGGGTGGHIFPAVSIANRLKETDPSAEILFVGAEGRMEMEKVPAAGYRIIGLPVAGLVRKLSLENLMLPVKVVRSYFKARKIILEFKPDAVIGVGGYASAPTLWCASHLGIPCLIQEQNSFAGLTNRILGKHVRKICVAYDGMKRFFPADKIVFTGNPIRKGFAPATQKSRTEGIEFYNLDPSRRQILIIGGSLGSKTLNDSVMEWIRTGCPGGDDVEILWQCGKLHKKSVDNFMEGRDLPYIHHCDFISRMDLAYAAADIVISRSGASSISEICVCRKATIFVPSPNVAEDHQTFNAMSLVNKGAAHIVKDDQARAILMTKAMNLVHNRKSIASIEKCMVPLGISDADKRIVSEIYNMLGLPVPKNDGTPAEEIPEMAPVVETPEETPVVEAPVVETPGGTPVVEAPVVETPEETPVVEKPSSEVKNVYFIGIGGIGMSAIARYYNSKGYKVSGYDRTPSPLTGELEKEGIDIHYEDNANLVPKDIHKTLVVYTPAIPENMGELQYARKSGHKVVKRSKMLGEISNGMHCLAVAGTHGKTTTSTLLGHIFQNSGIGCNAFLGGISKNYGTNLLLSEKDIIVAEADEFDRSFLQLHPEIAVITAMDADHLDIYNDLQSLHEAFRTFASQVSSTLIAKISLPLEQKDTPAKLLRYSLADTDADFYASDMESDLFGHYTFTLNYPGGKLEHCRCGIPGWVNVENSVAAAAAALSFGVKPEVIKDSIASYNGVKRRFDIQVNNGRTIYIDDYAHHPEELRSAIDSIRGMFPEKKLTAVFQPHLYTRTRDFAAGFAASLSRADKVILLDIYPAREEPIEGVTSRIILDALTCPDKMLISKEDLLTTLDKENPEILVTFGAGDIDRFVEPIAKMINEKSH